MTSADTPAEAPKIPAPVLEAFRFVGPVQLVGGGLINATFATRSEDQGWIVQRVNPIFAPENHRNIVAVTEHLRAAGVRTPCLRRTQDGAPYLVHEGETWRAMDRVEGLAHNTATDPAVALDAARFVARWHDTCASLKHDFVSTRSGVHDTAAHLQRLREALASSAQHRLHGQVAELSDTLLRTAEALPPLPPLRLPVAHGDLKLNNLVFDGGDGPPRARALIDLDTVAPMQLGHELGDALRSWSNRASESDPAAKLDAALAREISQTYLEARGLARDADAHAALLHGPEWISLELSARFLADALNESYFGWDTLRFPARGEHNLARARGQWSLYKAFADSRLERSAR